MTLQQTILKQLSVENEKRANALSNFFYNRKEDLINLAASRPIEVFFENKALGMSIEYGLKQSIPPIKQQFYALLDRYKNKPGKRSLYLRIAFLDEHGKILVEAYPTDSRPQILSEAKTFLSPEQDKPTFILRNKGKEIIVSLAYYFKGKYAGQMVAWLQPDYLKVDLMLDSSSSHRISFLVGNDSKIPLSEGSNDLPEVEEMRIGEVHKFQFTDKRNKKQDVIGVKTPVQNTPFAVATVVPVDELFEGLEPKGLLIGMGVLAIVIIGGAIFSYRLSINSLMLSARLDEAHRHETEILEKNKQLKAEVAERKQVEEMVRVSRLRYQTLLENTSDWVWEVDENARYTYVSPRVYDLLGYKPEEVLGKTPFDLMPDDEQEGIAAMFYDIATQRKSFTALENKNQHKDGHHVFLETSGVPFFDESGTFRGYRGIDRDISERKRAEEDRARLEAQLLQAQKMEAVGQLAGGIAHDFNNMLTAIIGYASLLEAKLGTDSPLKPYVDQILSSSEKSANLTSQLLAFSRKQIMSPKETDLNELIKGMEILLKSLIGEDVEFKTCFTDMHLTAMVDRGQIEQVLLNLCANARDAMPHGGLLAISTEVRKLDEKSIRTYDLDQPGRYALISVTDSGHGMEETTRERIFEPFYTTKEIGKGTGLGLSIVYGIIKQHNGNITVYSEPGKGTTFKIFLPLVVSPMGAANKEGLVDPRGGPEAILVSEDDEAVRSLTSHVLREAGYTVIEAVDGDDAINKFMENRDRIKLAILDVVMPKKSGKEVSDAIRKTKSDIRVLLTSGYTADIISTKGIGEEGLDFISKPITPNTLLRKVREILDR
jgi:PAS domain S-box-containing protein